jgi:uridine kinase
MPVVLPGYLTVVEALDPIMEGLPGVIVAIDGRSGVGKTTLGRYLAWHFNVTLIETDLFLIPAEDYVIHLDDQLNRLIERRMSLRCPIIVEGVSMLQLLKRINRVPDFSIYVANPEPSRNAILGSWLSHYEAAFAPAVKADLVVTLEH